MVQDRRNPVEDCFPIKLTHVNDAQGDAEGTMELADVVGTVQSFWGSLDWETLGSIQIPAWIGREAALVLFVIAMIFVIATVTGGETQNTDLGPLAIRKHVRPRTPSNHSGRTGSPKTQLLFHVDPKGASVELRRKQKNSVRQSVETIFVPKTILEMKNDGVIGNCTFYYTFERGGRVKKQRLITLRHVQLRVVGVNIAPLELTGGANTIQPDRVRDVTMIRGSEVDENFERADVILPDASTDQIGDVVQVTESRALPYANRIELLKNWQGDDALKVITLNQDLVEEIASARNQFLADAVHRVQKLRNRKWPKAKTEEVEKIRPTVVGTYVLRLSFDKTPWFVLSRHPDRDVRITAWLTVLTSVFAMLMEAWPLHTSWIDRAEAGPSSHSEQPSSRTVPPRPRR